MRTSRPRRPWGGVCNECRRQKQRCDRQTPCGNCIRRRIAHLCSQARSSQEPRSSSSSHKSHTSHTGSPVGLAPLPPPPPPPPPPAVLSVPPQGLPAPAALPAERPRAGRIWRARDAPSYHGESFFGPQAAAGLLPHVDDADVGAVMTGGGPAAAGPRIRTRTTMTTNGVDDALGPSLPGVHLTSSAHRRGTSTSHHGALSLHAHIWELLGHVPRPRAVVDALVARFLTELNASFDALHPASFLPRYEAFWQRRWGDDDLLTLDLRWLSLLFMVLAFSELLLADDDADGADGTAGAAGAAGEHEETSLQFFWAARKGVVIAPTFSGESADLVRAGLLITRYLVFAGRKAEAWLTNSFAVRMAQAQGMHVDDGAAAWGLPPEVSATRRRLWAALYTLDRSLALALGRPYVVHDAHWDAAAPAVADVADPAYYLPLQQRLSTLLGRIQDECFGLRAASFSSATSYDAVRRLDAALLAWADALPPVFRLHRPDVALDAAHPHLVWHRRYLHAQFHFARVTLHRSYVVACPPPRRDALSSSSFPSPSPPLHISRDACLASARADLALQQQPPASGAGGAAGGGGRPRMRMADRLRASLAAHHLFNGALVLGLLAVREPLAPASAGLLAELQAYCAARAADPWANDFVLAEVRVIELCLASAQKARDDAVAAAAEAAAHDAKAAEEAEAEAEAETQAEEVLAMATPLRDPAEPPDGWLDSWLGRFPEADDFARWADLVGNLEKV